MKLKKWTCKYCGREYAKDVTRCPSDDCPSQYLKPDFENLVPLVSFRDLPHKAQVRAWDYYAVEWAEMLKTGKSLANELINGGHMFDENGRIYKPKYYFTDTEAEE